jgi:2-dehydropantoate 2-reductase
LNAVKKSPEIRKSPIMKICFFGVGGVGGYFGALVTKELGSKHDIYFIARGRHKEKIIEHGLTLKKSGGAEVINVHPKACTESVTDLPICDLIIVSVKSYDLADAVKSIKHIANDTTVILPLLNGVDIYDRIREHLSIGIVLPSCVYVGTHIESPGVIYQKGGSCKIHIGKDPGFPEFYPEKLLHILKDSHIEFSWEENIQIAIWSKFMFIAAYGLVGAAYDKSLGEILENPELSQKVKSIMHEIKSITNKLNIPLDENIEEESFLKAKQFPFEAKTSFQRDVELKGKVNEADLFGGTLIRYGKSSGVSTTTITFVFNKLISRLS